MSDWVEQRSGDFRILLVFENRQLCCTNDFTLLFATKNLVQIDCLFYSSSSCPFIVLAFTVASGV